MEKLEYIKSIYGEFYDPKTVDGDGWCVPFSPASWHVSEEYGAIEFNGKSGSDERLRPIELKGIEIVKVPVVELTMDELYEQWRTETKSNIFWGGNIKDFFKWLETNNYKISKT